MKKNLFTAVAIILPIILVSCKTTGNKTEILPDWVGIYTGIIPSGSGEGINVKITLSADETYAAEYQYIGKSDSIFTDTGKFGRNPDKKDVIVFEKESEDNYPAYYKLGENALTQLDLEGNIITGELADNYILKKRQGQ